MKLTIIAPDGTVGIDGDFRHVDLSGINQNFRAVQWDGTKGHIEFEDGSPNQPINNITQFNHIVAAWTALTPQPAPPPTAEEIALLQAQQDKEEKQAALDAIVVTTTSGKVFNGDLESRVNMMSAIIASDFLGATTARWKLADNSKATVNLNEVKEALALSIQRVGEIVAA